MIDEHVVKKIAHLARLELSEQDCLLFSEQFKTIISHFEEISKISTEGIVATASPIEIPFRERTDVACSYFNAEEILKNAPERSGNLFKVPPVV